MLVNNTMQIFTARMQLFAQKKHADCPFALDNQRVLFYLIAIPMRAISMVTIFKITPLDMT